MTTTTTTPVTHPVWQRTAKGVQTWYSPVGPVVIFREGAYWYTETPTRKVARIGNRPARYSGITTAESAKIMAVSQVKWEVGQAVKAHTPTPAFPFVVGQRVSSSFGTATVIKADRPGWIEIVWDDGTDATGEEFDASEFVPA